MPTNKAIKKKAWYVYLLLCKDRTLYCGTTNNIKKRIAAHNEGKGAKYTSGRGPVKLMWKERLPNRSQAQKREAVIKKLSRGEKQLLFKTK